MKARATFSPRSATFFETIVAAGLAGASSIACIHPLDTLKTLVQSRIAAGGASNGWAVAREVLSTSGIVGLYAGAAGAISGAAPAAAVKLSTFDLVQKRLRRRLPPRFASAIPFLAGATAGFAGCLVYVPSEVVKQRQQTGMFSALPHAVASILKTEGPLGLYAGFWSTVARDLPYSFIELPIFAQLKALYEAHVGRRQLRTHENFALGGLAGAVANLLTTPMDVVKTQVMLQRAATVPAAMRLVLDQSGPMGFFSGAGLRVAMGVPTSAIFFGVFESAKSALASLHRPAGDEVQ